MEQSEQVKILEYWRAFESFIMPSIEHNKKTVGIEQVPLILESDKSLPWPLLHKIVKTEKEESLFVFNVYVGIVEQSKIHNKIQQILGNMEVDYNLPKNRGLTCLAGFVVDEAGHLLETSYVASDFVKGLYALEEFNITHDWIHSYENAKEMLESLGQSFTNHQRERLTFADIEAHLEQLLGVFDNLSSSEIKFPAIVHVKKVLAPFAFDKIEINECIFDFEEIDGAKQFDTADNVEIIREKERETTLDIMPSFFIDDLNKVINSLKNGESGEALQAYLCASELNVKKDLYQDKGQLKEFVSPGRLPASTWPDSRGNPLVFAQQLAVNEALSKKKGLFSVNGPPGTGKSTLLRDIVSDVVVRRAECLSKFEQPIDAFGKGILTKENNFSLKSLSLDECLFDYELVVAAANNNAVENVTRELPDINVIDELMLNANEDNEYFSQVAAQYFDNDKCWGMISAILGNQVNNNKFFDTFWNKKNKNSMRYLLERWTFHNENFKELVEAKVFGEKDEHIWLKENFHELEKKIKVKWKCEKKTFNVLMIKFKKIQQQYIDLDEYFREQENNEIQIVKINTELLEYQEVSKVCHNFLNDLEKNSCQLQEEFDAIDHDLGHLKKILLAYEEYQKAKNELNNVENVLGIQKEQLIALEQGVIQLSSAMDFTEQMIKDLEQEKHDLLILKPNWFFHIFLFNGKKIKGWQQNFLNLSIKHHDKKSELRVVKEKICQSNIDLKKIKAVQATMQESFYENQAILRHKEAALYAFGDNIDGDLLTKEILSHESARAKKRECLDNIAIEKNDTENILTTTIASVKRETLKLKKLQQRNLIILEETSIIMKDFSDDEDNIPHPVYWKKNNNDIQRTSPWINKKIQEIRTQLFWSAIRLHKYFVILARKHLISNINALAWLLKGKLPQEHDINVRSIWSSLFLIVPVVSTAFASVQRLFKHLKQEEIGWLLIDEAGQVLPHAAVGAIWRSKRVIVVGDPLQIEPVVTLPKILSQKLYQYYQVDALYDVATQSVQTLADLSNDLGTFIGEEDDKIWVGAPLIIHRRCMEPMFTVSNNIAYNGLMIQSTNHVISSIDNYFNQSLWISPKKGGALDPDTHWIEAEGNIACYLLDVLIKKLNTMPSIYIITPFTSIKEELFKHISKKWIGQWSELLNIEVKILYSQLEKMIGTVHTFQGKQADTVILLLGGNIRKRGAIEWASKKPNLLNVAITRAKKLLYVIGDIKIWGEQPYFYDLAEKIKVVYDSDGFFKSCFLKNPEKY